MSIGKPGKKGAIGKEREVFLSLSGGRKCVGFDGSNLDDAIDLLKRLVHERLCGKLRPCQPEHRLEAMILRGSLPIAVDGAETLECVTPKDGLPFQFPTRWSSKGSVKYVDALMRNSSVPWVIEIIEIKESADKAGEYLRHSVVQAVLYREYVRKAEHLHPWFKERDLAAEKCEAAVAFPALKQSNKEELEHVNDLATLFDVRVVELPDITDKSSR